MKRLTSRTDSPSVANHNCQSRCIVLSLLIIVSFGLTSCIYEAPGDRFYRTLWKATDISSTNHHGTDYIADNDFEYLSDTACLTDIADRNDAMHNELSGLTIEFLCNSSVRISASGFAGSYGTYTASGSTAYFENLQLSNYQNGSPTIIIIENAYRTHETLTANWHYSGSDTSYTLELTITNIP